MEGNLPVSSPVSVVIAASFTSEPIEPFLRYWLRKLGLGDSVTFAPYNQIFQELIDRSSQFSTNLGVNVVLLRLEDSLRFNQSNNVVQTIRSNLIELIASLKNYAKRSSIPILIWVSPPSQIIEIELLPKFEIKSLLEEFQNELRNYDSIHFLTDDDLKYYPVESFEDLQSYQVGHIPFTTEYYCALATAIARRIHCMRISITYKVLALDCDHTLWSGVVGEDGPQGITIPKGKRKLQELVVRLQEQGMLVCLVSKNIESDVLAVFESRPEMPLKLDHIVGMRINWQSKPNNLIELAKELNLGLDSFIFLDDNPMECAEVKAVLPQVVTIRIPSSDEDISEFLDHIWVFDRIQVTEEDRKRTQMYQENFERNQFESQTASITDFIRGLNLTIDFSQPKENQWARLSQLTQRTNQFNLTTIRRTEAEVRQLSSQNKDCFLVRVTDRFGDYGLVGFVVFGSDGDQLLVDTMLLSCRVLGRGVEHAMLANLGKIAQERMLKGVTLPFIPTPKNLPAHKFLESVASSSRQKTENGFLYQIPASTAAIITYSPDAYGQEALQLARTDGSKTTSRSSSTGLSGDKSKFYSQIAFDLRKIHSVQQLVQKNSVANRPELDSAYVEPETPQQRDLTEIWTRLLSLDRIGIHDDFNALGGTSLIAARLFAEIEQRFGVRLPMTTILEASTIASLCQKMNGKNQSSLKILRRGNPEGQVLFLVHDGDGETLLYLNLTRYLPRGISVYGLEPASKPGYPCLQSRIPEIANYYIQQIKSVCPEGPYFLGGLCAGGVIAYEIAAQLQKSGEEIGHLFMLDSASPHARSLPGYMFRQKSERIRNALRKQGKQSPLFIRLYQSISVLANKAKNFLSYQISNRLKKLKEQQQFKQFQNSLDLNKPVPISSQNLSFRRIYEMTENQYFPGSKLDCSAILFRASKGEGIDEPFLYRYLDPVFDWNRYFQQPVQLIEVSGGHSTMLQDPHVRVIAGKIGEILVNTPGLINSSTG